MAACDEPDYEDRPERRYGGSWNRIASIRAGPISAASLSSDTYEPATEGLNMYKTRWNHCTSWEYSKSTNRQVQRGYRLLLDHKRASMGGSSHHRMSAAIQGESPLVLHTRCQNRQIHSIQDYH